MTPPRIVSVSRRTDIPAFYAAWFMNRLRAGFCLYPNPRFPRTRHRVSLRPEDVAGFVFWTRDAAPLLPHLAELESRGVPFYFHCTLTGYPRALEPGVPPAEQALATLRTLADRVGPRRIIWRYDPVILSPGLTPARHRDTFRRLADALAPLVRHLVVSVVDPYARTRRSLGTSRDGIRYDLPDYADTLAMIAAAAAERGLAVRSCAEPAFAVGGIAPAPCVDASILNELRGTPAPARPPARHRLRDACLCHASVDIGAADSCGGGCLYCYATRNHAKARTALAAHDPDGSSII